MCSVALPLLTAYFKSWHKHFAGVKKHQYTSESCCMKQQQQQHVWRIKELGLRRGSSHSKARWTSCAALSISAVRMADRGMDTRSEMDESGGLSRSAAAADSGQSSRHRVTMESTMTWDHRNWLVCEAAVKQESKTSEWSDCKTTCSSLSAAFASSPDRESSFCRTGPSTDRTWASSQSEGYSFKREVCRVSNTPNTKYKMQPWTSTHSSGVPGLFQHLFCSLKLLFVFDASQRTHLLLDTSAQTLHHLGKETHAEWQSWSKAHGTLAVVLAEIARVRRWMTDLKWRLILHTETKFYISLHASQLRDLIPVFFDSVFLTN